MEGKKRGQPKKEPTTLINFRIKKTKKEKLIELFEGEINRMFDNWIDTLIKTKEDEKGSNDDVNIKSGSISSK